MNAVVAFVNSDEEPLKREVVCYYTKENSSISGIYVDIMVVENLTYPHPDAPDQMSISLISTRLVKTVNMRSVLAPDSATANLLSSIQVMAHEQFCD